MRSNTQALINSNLDTEKSIKGSVLPMLDRLLKEIKSKAKELHSGPESSAKEVEKLRNATQKHIELLGQHTAAFASAGGKISSTDDPYVLHRGVLHRLASQVVAENNHRNDMMAIQNNFHSFDAHIVKVVQQTMEAFVQLAGGQGQKVFAFYNDMLSTVQAVPADFEWIKFTTRYGDRLLDPMEPPRSVAAIQFPNMDHASTKPLIEGTLERKSRNKLAWGYSTGYYVVTPSRFLHEFKDSDDTRQDPKPELSIYLPDAVIGAPNGDKFNIKGKDKSKTVSSKLTGSTEMAFKAHTPDDAQKWFDVITKICGATGPAEPSSPVAASPSRTEASPPLPAAATSSAQDSAAAADADADTALGQDAALAAPTPELAAGARSSTALPHKAQEAGIVDAAATISAPAPISPTTVDTTLRSS